MTGRYAGEVKFNYEGIGPGCYSRDLFREWERAMKLAISADINEEEFDSAVKSQEASWRYGLACEELIIGLLFKLKWVHMLHRDDGDESQD